MVCTLLPREWGRVHPSGSGLISGLLSGGLLSVFQLLVGFYSVLTLFIGEKYIYFSLFVAGQKLRHLRWWLGEAN